MGAEKRAGSEGGYVGGEVGPIEFRAAFECSFRESDSYHT